MEILFLGTAAAEAYPALFCDCENCLRARNLGGKNIRCRSSAVINNNLLIDYGPDVSSQTRRYNIPLQNVRNILQTHSHWDHLLMYDMLFRSKSFHRKTPLELTTIWGNNMSQRKILDQMSHLFATEFGGDDPEMNPTRWEVKEELPEYLKLSLEGITPHQTLRIGQTPILKKQMYTVHTIDAHHAEPEASMNFIIDDGTCKFLYGTDTGPWDDTEWDFVASLGIKLDVVALDCTVGTGTPGGHHSIESFLAMKREFEKRSLLSSNALFLAHHFSHQYCPVHDDLVKIMEPEGVQVTYDGMKLTFTGAN
jgi:phosphoribosyl 1,2-cyclic phosphate phosphodiesterase